MSDEQKELKKQQERWQNTKALMKVKKQDPKLGELLQTYNSIFDKIDDEYNKTWDEINQLDEQYPYFKETPPEIEQRKKELNLKQSRLAQKKQELKKRYSKDVDFFKEGSSKIQKGIEKSEIIPENLPEKKSAKIIDLSSLNKKELPMDQASRMARAKDMGFDVDTPVYHGTDATFSEFKIDPHRRGKTLGPGVYTTSNPEIASKYSSYTGSTSGQQVYPLFLKGKTFDFSNPEHLKLLSKGNNKTFEDVIENYETLEDAALEVKKLGFDSARIKRGDEFNEIITFDPKNIRSTFAKFDPSKIDSSDISSFAPKTAGEKAIGAAAKGLKYLDKGLTKLGHLGTAMDIAEGNIPEAALDVAETALAKTGSAGVARVLPFLELLRPTEMEPKDDVTSDIPMKPERFRKLKQLYNKEE